MKIHLPIQCQKVELTDNEKIFCFMMLMVSKKANSKDWGKYEYTFHGRDVMHILGGKWGDSSMNNLREIFDIGVLNQYTYRVSWKRPMCSKGMLKFPAWYETDLNDPSLFVMYGYLLGRLYDPKSIFSDEEELIYDYVGTKNAQVHHLYASYRLNH